MLGEEKLLRARKKNNKKERHKRKEYKKKEKMKDKSNKVLVIKRVNHQEVLFSMLPS